MMWRCAIYNEEHFPIFFKEMNPANGLVPDGTRRTRLPVPRSSEWRWQRILSQWNAAGYLVQTLSNERL